MAILWIWTGSGLQPEGRVLLRLAAQRLHSVLLWAAAASCAEAVFGLFGYQMEVQISSLLLARFCNQSCNVNCNRLVWGGIINTFLCRGDYFCIQLKVRLESLNNFSGSNCFSTSLLAIMFEYWVLCTVQYFSDMATILSKSDGVLYVCCSGLFRRRAACTGKIYSVCANLCTDCSWLCLGGLQGMKKCILHENDTNCVFFLAFQGEGCRTVPLSGHVGFDSLPDQLVNKSVNHGFCFNILCVGEYFHLGKFCCWKGLLCSWV